MINQTKNKGLPAKTVALFAVFLIYVAHKVLPAVGYYIPAIGYLGLFAILGLLLLTYYSSLIQNPKVLVLLGCFLISFLTVVQYLIRGEIADIPIYLYGEFQTVFYGVAVICLMRKADDRSIRKLFWIFIAFYAITAVTTYIGCISYPLASRQLATFSTTDPTYQLYVKNNIGGFRFVYELVLLTPLFIYMLRCGRFNRVFAALLLIGTGIVIIQTEYATALIFYVFALCVLLFKKLTVKKITIAALIAVALLVIFSAPLAGLLDNIANGIESDTLAARFQEMADMLRGQDVEEGTTTQNRMDFYMKSLSSFVNSGFMGVWSDRSIGGHSFVFDSMGRFGIVGIAAVLLVFWCIYRFALKPYKHEDFYPYLFLVYIFAIAMAVLNPKIYMFVFICIIPLFAHAMMRKSPKGEEVLK